VIRNSHLFSFDMSALSNAHSPASTISPNGLTGEEACTLFRYAGMSPTVNTVGVYGYDPRLDRQDLTAKQIAQQLWYLLDGRSRGKREASLTENDTFN
jgi:arginase family enzyme